MAIKKQRKKAKNKSKMKKKKILLFVQLTNSLSVPLN